MDQVARATAKYVAIAPQKVRRVVDLVRGRGAVEAMKILAFLPSGAAKPVAKAIRSAIANAEENLGLSRDDLFIQSIYADEGPTRRWRRFGARGRIKPLLKRSSHITVMLGEREA